MGKVFLTSSGSLLATLNKSYCKKLGIRQGTEIKQTLIGNKIIVEKL